MEEKEFPQEALDLIARNAKRIQYLEDPANKEEKDALIEEAANEMAEIEQRIPQAFLPDLI